MTTPCENLERITRIEGGVGSLDEKLDRLDGYHQTHGRKLDTIADSLAVLAVQKEKIDTLSTQVGDHETRIRKIEDTPSRVLWWCAGIAAAVIAGAVLHRLAGVA